MSMASLVNSRQITTLRRKPREAMARRRAASIRLPRLVNGNALNISSAISSLVRNLPSELIHSINRSNSAVLYSSMELRFVIGANAELGETIERDHQRRQAQQKRPPVAYPVHAASKPHQSGS